MERVAGHRALRALRRAAAQRPRDPEVALALSRSLLERARHDGDARLAGQALGALGAWDADPDPPLEVRLQRATLHQHLHAFDAAAAELEAALRAAPRHPQALLTLATVRRVQGRDHHLSLNAEPLDAAAEWIEYHRQFWEQSLAALEQFVMRKPRKTAKRSKRK